MGQTPDHKMPLPEARTMLTEMAEAGERLGTLGLLEFLSLHHQISLIADILDSEALRLGLAVTQVERMPCWFTAQAFKTSGWDPQRNWHVLVALFEHLATVCEFLEAGRHDWPPLTLPPAAVEELGAHVL